MKVVEKLKKKKASKKKEVLDNLRKTIDLIDEKIVFYKEVKKHISKDCKGAATGKVWDYSPYLSNTDVDSIIENLNSQRAFVSTIFAQLLIVENIKDVDKNLKDFVKECTSNNLKNSEDKICKTLKNLEDSLK